MKIKLYQNYNPKNPVNNSEISASLRKYWKKIDEFYDFDEFGFNYNTTNNSNKHLEENSIAIWLLLKRIDNTTESKLTKKDLLQTLDILLKNWKNDNISAIYAKNWKNEKSIPDAAKIIDLSLATLEACKVSGDKKYLFSLIEIIRYLINNYRINQVERVLSNYEDGAKSWAASKFVLLLNNLHSFFSIDENKPMYEPELSSILLKNKNESIVDFMNQIKFETFYFLQELYLFLGKPNYGFYRKTIRGHKVKEVKLYGNSIIGLCLNQILDYDLRDITRDVSQYHKNILSLTNTLWDANEGGYYRLIDFNENELGIINKDFKNIISNILATRFLVGYINHTLARLNITNIDKVSYDLLQIVHQVDVTVKKLLNLPNPGILEIDDNWINIEKSEDKLHPVYLFLDLLYEYRNMNYNQSKELSIIRDKISILLYNKIFLSHNSKDKEIIDTIDEKLRDNNYSTFYDKKEKSDPKTNQINVTLLKGMEYSSVVIFFITEHFSEKSEGIDLEINEALKQKKIRGEFFTIIVIVIGQGVVPLSLKKYWRSERIDNTNPDYKLDIFSNIINKIPQYIKTNKL